MDTSSLYEVAFAEAAQLAVIWEHAAAEPAFAVGVAGVPGLTVTARLEAALVPQLFPAVTEIFPFCPAAPVVTFIEVVPEPAVIDHPVGTVQLYVVAFVTAVML